LKLKSGLTEELSKLGTLEQRAITKAFEKAEGDLLVFGANFAA
jgi:hypothetical protein